MFQSYGITCCNYSITEDEKWQHISDVFEPENDDDEIEDMDLVPEVSSSPDNLPTQIMGPPSLQEALKTLCVEYTDIFNKVLQKIPAAVEPLTFEYDAIQWNRHANRLPARTMSTDKQQEVSLQIDKLLTQGIIRPSKSSAWSQVVIVKKPGGRGWRLTIDFRNLNLVVVNQGWQIPNIQQMINRIGDRRPQYFAVADLTSGYFQMPLTEESIPATAFITYRGLYEFVRVPMGLLHAANYFQRTMTEQVLCGLVYHI